MGVAVPKVVLHIAMSEMNEMNVSRGGGGAGTDGPDWEREEAS